MADYRIAVIPGDGIGKEVVPEGLKVIEAARRLAGFTIETEFFPWGSEHYLQTGEMIPKNGLDVLAGVDAIYLGAVGDPAVPDHVTLWGLLLPIRKGFDLYVNLRPVNAMRRVLAAGHVLPRDLGGTASTSAVGDAVVAALA